MLYYPNATSKANHFCVDTATAIRHYLQHRRDPDRRGTFSARDLTEAGIQIPKGGLRTLRSRGWIRRLETTPSSPRRVWRLTGSALLWLERRAPKPTEAV